MLHHGTPADKLTGATSSSTITTASCAIADVAIAATPARTAVNVFILVIVMTPSFFIITLLCFVYSLV
jgi:hypothetical protein